MELPKSDTVEAFAVIVDINHFTKIVRDADGDLISQFVRDVLSGGISAIEDSSGEVVGFMGDAILGLVPDAEAFFGAAVVIAKDLDRQCEYISGAQSEDASIWAFAHGGVGLKITCEFGMLDVSTIYSRILGKQRLFIGDAINYAARIGAAGEGNRCLLGPEAARLLKSAGHEVDGPKTISGKAHEPDFEYYQLDLCDIWREGLIEPGDDRHLG